MGFDIIIYNLLVLCSLASLWLNDKNYVLCDFTMAIKLHTILSCEQNLLNVS